MPYKFKRYCSSLKTGKTYKAGMLVPNSLLQEPAVLTVMLASGDIELVAPTVAPVPIEELPEATVSKRKKKDSL